MRFIFVTDTMHWINIRWFDVQMTPLSGEELQNRKSNNSNEARIDIRIRDFYEKEQHAIFDLKVFSITIVKKVSNNSMSSLIAVQFFVSGLNYPMLRKPSLIAFCFILFCLRSKVCSDYFNLVSILMAKVSSNNNSSLTAVQFFVCSLKYPIRKRPSVVAISFFVSKLISP